MIPASRVANKVAELAGALAFAGMLGAFLLQIVARYVFDYPLGWPDEIAAILFVWIVFWAGAFLISPGEHIRFALVRDALPPRLRRWADAALAVLFGLLHLAALPVVVDYLLFTFNQWTALIELSLGYVYASFVVFFIASTCRLFWDAAALMRGPPQG